MLSRELLKSKSLTLHPAFQLRFHYTAFKSIYNSFFNFLYLTCDPCNVIESVAKELVIDISFIVAAWYEYIIVLSEGIVKHYFKLFTFFLVINTVFTHNLLENAHITHLKMNVKFQR